MDYYMVLFVSILCLGSGVFGYIIGKFYGYSEGIKETETRWSIEVQKSKIMTGRGLVPGPNTFKGP